MVAWSLLGVLLVLFVWREVEAWRVRAWVRRAHRTLRLMGWDQD